MGQTLLCEATWTIPKSIIPLNVSKDIINKVYDCILNNVTRANISYERKTSWNETQICTITIDNGLLYLTTNSKCDRNKKYNLYISQLRIFTQQCINNMLSDLKLIHPLQSALLKQPTNVCTIILALLTMPLLDDIKKNIIMFLLNPVKNGVTQNIYIYRNTGTWQIGADLFHGCCNIEEISDYIPAINTNKKILNYISNIIGTTNYDKFTSFESDDKIITAIQIYTLQYRRGKVYLFAQINNITKTIRIVAYGEDYVYHSAVCFGTNPILHVDGKDIIKKIKEYIPPITNNNTKLDTIINAINNNRCEYFI